MKSIKLLNFIIIVLYHSFLHSIEIVDIPKIIFTPIPLLQPNLHHQKIISYFKQYTLAITACFYYAIDSQNIITDIKNNPYTTTCIICAISYYISYLISQNEKEKIEQEIILLMQQIFHLLIIGQGLCNHIANQNYHKNATVAQTYTDHPTLYNFLFRTYQSWIIVSSFYQDYYNKNFLYKYDMHQIDLFEVMQACNYEPDLTPFITDFYNSTIHYNHEFLLQVLEQKLDKIKLKIIENLPKIYCHCLEK